MIERIIDPQETPEDNLGDFNRALRPERLTEFVGQQSMKDNMKVYIQAALERKEPLDHILLSGPPGLGKTTFAHILAREMSTNIKSTTAPVIEKPGDMASILSSLKEREILFIDEIHRLKPVIEEVLYSAMEDYHIDIHLGQGMTAQSVKITLPPFTLVGATTRPGSLTQPLLSRFGITCAYEFYTRKDLEEIVAANASKLKITIDKSGIEEIASRSRGTPRILNRILRRVRDFAQVEKKDRIDKDIADFALGKMNIDKQGLDAMDIRVLSTIINNFGGGPVGLENLATSLGEDSATIEEMVEPYLIQSGLLKRGPRGRMVTSRGFKYLNLDKSGNDQTSLF